MSAAETTRSPTRSSDGAFHVVGVGASAGGLEALEKLFEGMPVDSGMAFVVVQHLSPDFPSHLPELLARHTTIPIQLVTHGVQVEPDSIYLIPPGKEMIVSDGRLLLTDKSPGRSLTHPIDQFLRSLAGDRGRFSIAVILSGTGSDGSRGIEFVHESGGLVIAQTPETAKFDGMPRSAFETGVVDLSLAPEEIAAALSSYASGDVSPKELAAQRSEPPSDATEQLFAMLRAECDIDFSQYRATTVNRRLERRLSLRGDADLPHYLSRLESDPEERRALCRDLLIGVTRFFRDPEAFEILRTKIVREITTREEPIRAWVAGCATGEEAYSLAILLHEEYTRAGQRPEFKVFATDVHRDSLSVATAGLYSEDRVGELSEEQRQRYFRKEVDGYRVTPELRQTIVFAPHNLLHDAPFTQLDLILCRNLLIYFEPPAQRKVLGLFHFALKAGGVLFLGPSESPGPLSEEFSDVDKRWRLFRKRRDIRLPPESRFPLPNAAILPVRPPSGAPWQQARSSERHLLGVYDRLLSQYMPAGFLVDPSFRLIHTFGGAERLLRVPSGRPSTNLLDLVDPSLRNSMSAALQHALRDGAAVSHAGVRVPGEDTLFNLVVEPVETPELRETQLLVKLEPREARPPLPERVEIDASEATRERIGALESELQLTQENLQATVEELETANEELQASNEELVASNEELQSTNEELHSVNEELYTVNIEHQRKIVELSDLTADMENLMAATDVGVVFVDRGLRIRRFTPPIAKAFHFLDGDIGRRIDEFTNELDHPGLVDDLRLALQGGEVVEREVQDKTGNPFLVRVTPYRARSAIDGAVLTLIDIRTLREAEADLHLFKQISDQAPDGHLVVDHEGRVFYANAAVSRWLGSSAEKLDGLPLDRIVPELGPETFDGGDPEPASLRTEIRTPEGGGLPVEASWSPVRFKGRSYAHVVLRDVRHRQETERRIAVEHAVAQVLADETRWEEALPAVLDAFLESLGVDVAEYWTQPEEQGPLRIHTMRFRSGLDAGRIDLWREASQPLEIDPRSSSNGLIRVAWSRARPTWLRDLADEERFVRRVAARELGLRTGLAIPLTPGGDERLGVLVVYSRGEIGDDRAIENMLSAIAQQLAQFVVWSRREDEMRLRDRAMAAASDGIVIVDARAEDLPIIYVNEGFQRITGYSAAEAVGRNCRFLQGPRTNRRMIRRMRGAITAGKAFGGTVLNYRRDGTRFWNDVQITPVHDAEGQLTHFIGIQHDVSRERTIQAELRIARRAADAANQAKSEFLANMSHEIRTPMTAILGFTEVLDARLRDSEQRERVAAIRRNARHLLGIIDDILDLSKIEAGKVEMDVRPSVLAPLLYDVRSTMEPRARERGIDLRLEYETPVPETILTDSARVRQVLLNVVGNAIKFTEDGRVEILVSLLDENGPLQIRVRDTGVGMTEEQQARLFDPFSQGSPDITERYGGTGLGLSITRRLLDQLGGTIDVESRPNEGSTFTLCIPTGSLKGVPLTKPDPSRPPQDTEAKPWGPRWRLDCRVLVVDDQPDVRQVVEYFLREAGATVRSAVNGREAVDRVVDANAAGDPFDAVLMDMQMPGMSGYQATRTLRANGHAVPIIALTAAAMKGERTRCIRAGCDDYLSKPVEGSELVDAVARQLSEPKAVRLPDGASDSRPLEEKARPAPLADASGSQTGPTPARSRRVLLIDDSPDATEALAELMRMWGHDVATAESAYEARRTFESFRPDVVVSDIQLPDASGNELVRVLKDASTDGTRMIALSGAGEREAIQRSLDAGFDDYLVKPVEPERLKEILRVEEEDDDASPWRPGPGE